MKIDRLMLPLVVSVCALTACSSRNGGNQGRGGQTSGNGGTGGASDTGGSGAASGAGGTHSAGGSTGAGSTATSGGSDAPGGRAATGGGTSSGGMIATGGEAATGGKTLSGGTTRPGNTGARGGGVGRGGTPASGGATASRDGGRVDAGTGSAGTGGTSTCAPPASGSRSSNPLFTDLFTADPAVMVDNCTFYITCGHDQATAGQNAFVMREWYLMKSTDMVNWTKTVAMGLSTFKWANANAWAGQMIKALNGKYYWYVPVQQSSDGTMTIGVGVADQPEGPWTDALGKPLINDAFEMSNMGFATPSDTAFTIDPTVFIDDDAQAYLQYGGFGRMTTARLNGDMISIDGKMVEASPRGFFESPYLIKRNGKYYEIYAAGSNPATIDWATSSSPMGPWTYGGRILDALPRAAGETDWPTNHAGVGLLAGQWYIAYHVSNGPNGGGTYRRQVAVDALTWNGDAPQKVTPSSGMTF